MPVPDPGDKASMAMANTPTATDDVFDWGDPPLDLPNFFFEAERSSVQDYVGTFLETSIQHMFLHVANYDDNIIADLASFLEMATYEDPLDDLVQFWERACRWACSKRLVGPEGTFYLFAELPCEIRLMVWRECIPSQIHLAVERAHKSCVAQQVRGNHHRLFEATGKLLSAVDALLLGGRPHHGRYCSTSQPMTSGQKTPVIAKVNHEARMFALERKSKRYTLAFIHKGSNRETARIKEMPVWLDEKNDTVLINTRYTDAIGYPEDAVHLDEDRRSDLKEDRLFGMITRGKIQAAIFAATLNGPTLPSRLCQAFLNADRIDVVVGVFSFNGMTDSEAAVTELFGLFGEESMALIPADNLQSLRKLFTAHAAFRPRCGAEFFESLEAQYMDVFVNAWSRLDKNLIQKWDRHYRPSNFQAYCEEMRGFVSSTMKACELRLGAQCSHGVYQDEKTQWLRKVEEVIRNNTTFQPVFLVHRCQNPILVSYVKRSMVLNR